MSHTPYLSRRDGRYYLQIRPGRAAGALLQRTLFRASLRTSDYRAARRRLAECLGWMHRMNDSAGFPSLFAKNARQLSGYLSA